MEILRLNPYKLTYVCTYLRTVLRLREFSLNVSLKCFYCNIIVCTLEVVINITFLSGFSKLILNTENQQHFLRSLLIYDAHVQ